MDNRFYKPPAARTGRRTRFAASPSQTVRSRSCAPRTLALSLRALRASAADARRRALAQASPRLELRPPRCAERRRKSLPIIAAVPTRSAAGPTSRPWPRATSSFAAAASCIRADRAELRQPDDLRARTRQRAHQPRRQRLHRPASCSCSVQRFEGFFLEPTLLLRAHRRRRHARSASTSSTTSARARSAPPTRAARATARAARTGCCEPRASSSTSRPTKASPKAPCCAFSACRSSARRCSASRSPTRASRAGCRRASTSTARAASSSRCRTTGTSRRNRDATLHAGVLTRRGVGLGSEFRYLEPRYGGAVNLHLLPDDRVAGRDAPARCGCAHDGSAGARRRTAAAACMRVSDDDYWKDFPRALRSLTPRLLPLDAAGRAATSSARPATGRLYARVQRWQVLQRRRSGSADRRAVRALAAARRAQLQPAAAAASSSTLETEFNRFTLPTGEPDRGAPERRARACAGHAEPAVRDARLVADAAS